MENGNGEDKMTTRYKTLVVGDAGIGKTAFVMRYRNDTFVEAYVPTVGIDFIKKTLTRNNKNYHLEIWDTSGQERYKTITLAYYRGANGFVLMFDLTQKESFTDLAKKIEVIKEKEKDAIIVLVGNKADLTDKRAVTKDEAEKFAESKAIKYFETSVKNNTNINETIDYLLDALIEKLEPKEPAQPKEEPKQPKEEPKEPIDSKESSINWYMFWFVFFALVAFVLAIINC